MGSSGIVQRMVIKSPASELSLEGPSVDSKNARNPGNVLVMIHQSLDVSSLQNLKTDLLDGLSFCWWLDHPRMGKWITFEHACDEA